MPIVTLEELELDPRGHARSAGQHLEATASGFSLHLDLDVLSSHALPAVDYPDERALSWQQLLELLVPVLAAPGLLGARVAILNPTRDPGGSSAARVVVLLRGAVADARDLDS